MAWEFDRLRVMQISESERRRRVEDAKLLVERLQDYESEFWRNGAVEKRDKLPLAKVAAKYGISARALQRWITGDSIPSDANLNQLRAAINGDTKGVREARIEHYAELIATEKRIFGTEPPEE